MRDWRFYCEAAGHEVQIDTLDWCCPHDQSALLIDGPNELSSATIDAGTSTIARYASLLPVGKDDLLTLGAGMTPLVKGQLAGHAVWFKLDSMLPSGSFKDRGAALVISHYRRLGVSKIVVDSSGNAAAAMSAFSAAAGIECEVYCPATASPGKLVQARAYGATVIPVSGSRDAVAEAAQQAAADDRNAIYASHNWSALFAEGVKTWALEVWEQLGQQSPAAAFVPTGGGSALIGAARGFAATGNMPRLIAAQPTACAPVVAALEGGADHVEPTTAGATIAEGTKIASPPRDAQLLRAVRDSDGWGCAVSEDALKDALHALWQQGIYVEPTAALGAAAFIQADTEGQLPDGPSVILVTGSGLKSTDLNGELLDAQR